MVPRCFEYPVIRFDIFTSASIGPSSSAGEALADTEVGVRGGVSTEERCAAMDEAEMFARGREGLELVLRLDHEGPEVRAFVAGMVFAGGPKAALEALRAEGAPELVRELAEAARDGRGEPELELSAGELLREHRGY